MYIWDEDKAATNFAKHGVAFEAARDCSMTKRRIRDLTDAEEAAIRHGIRQDSDTVEITEEVMARMRPVSEAHPEIVAAYRRARGPQKAPTKQLVSLRLDRDVLERLRATGDGWQRLINDTLRRAVGL